MPGDNRYTTLEEAIDAARELFLADHPETEGSPTRVEQLTIQKYILLDGDIMWQAEFHLDDRVEGDGLPVLFGEAAQNAFDGEYDETDLLQEWPEENTLHEWDDGEFQHEPLDAEQQRTDDEWD